MTIKQQGGVFGRNPTFNNLEVDGAGTVDGALTVNGTSSFNSNLTVNDNLVRVVRSANTSRAEIGVDATSAYLKSTFSSGGTSDFRFLRNSSEIMRITANGITFGGDTAAANALDDYEEGTWTPAGNGITLTTAIGSYTKIGRIVCLSGKVVFPATSDGNLALLSNLPFAPANDTDCIGGSNVGQTDYSASTLFSVTSTLSRIYFQDPAGLLTNANLSGKTVHFSATYYVS